MKRQDRRIELRIVGAYGLSAADGSTSAIHRRHSVRRPIQWPAILGDREHRRLETRVANEILGRENALFAKPVFATDMTFEIRDHRRPPAPELAGTAHLGIYARPVPSLAYVVERVGICGEPVI